MTSDVGADLREEASQVGADGRDGGDDDNGDQRCDEAVLDGGRAAFVFHELCEHLRHLLLFLSLSGLRTGALA